MRSLQLFDLDADPSERNDLSRSEAHADIRSRLLARVLHGWDPERIATCIRERRLDKNVIDQWARTVGLPDEFRWHLETAFNQLEADMK